MTTETTHAGLIEMLREMYPQLTDALLQRRVVHLENGSCYTVDAAEFRRLLTWGNARRDAAVARERERIVRAIEHEADVTPCSEDAAVTKRVATLIKADFAYDQAEAIEVAGGTHAATLATLTPQLARRNFFIRAAIDQLDKAATTAANSGQKAREYDCGPMNAAAGTLRNALTDGPLTHPYDGWRLVSGDDGLRVERDTEIGG